MQIDGVVGHASLGQCLAALHAGAAGAAVVVAAFVARPRLAVVDAQLMASAGDVGLRPVGVGGEQGDAGEGAGLCGGAEGLHKFGAAVGIDGVVAAVVGHHHVLQSAALGQAHGHAEHDAVAEGHHRAVHVVVGIVAIGDVFAANEQRTLEVLPHEGQGHHYMLDAQPLAVQPGEGNLAGIVLGAIVEGHGQSDALAIVVEQRHRVHASTEDENAVFHFRRC